MIKIIRFLKIYYRGIFRFFYFLVAIAIIVIFLPREGRFRYEFQKGKPWMHNDLSAPFNFSIYKTEAELFEERNSILKNFTPFFQLDSSVITNSKMRFRIEFRKEWEDFIQELKKNNINRGNQGYSDINNNRSKYEQLFIELLETIYSKGIVNKTENLLGEGQKVQKISVLKNNIAHEVELKNLFTVQSALDYCLNRLNEVAEKDSPNAVKFWLDFNIMPYIQPNLLFDERITDKVRNQMLSAISLTRGMIQSGEKIIAHDEVVDSEKYLLLESLKKEYSKKIGQSNFGSVLFGQILIVSFLLFILYLYLLNYRVEILSDDSKILYILILITSMVVISSFVLRSSIISIYVIPFAIVPIFIKAFYDSRLALFVHLITIFLIGFFAPNGYEFIFINFIAGVVSIISLVNIYKRGRLFISISLILLTYWVVYCGLVIVQEGTLQAINWFTIAWFGGNALLLMASYQLIYFFEKMFGFLSDATLMEFSDTNQDLLRKLAEVAPGTFQHSLQVANLAEAAVYKIGGNPLLVRAGALYHDIGKIINPLFYIENQPDEFNPHHNLEFEESAAIIIKHVTEGVQIARKNKLPDLLIDFIRTHHGTNKVQYFYRLYKEKYDQNPEEEVKFIYPGPRPVTKEMAVLMMADSVEAASRSLKKVNFHVIDEMVENIIRKLLADEQLNDANITFKDITTIKIVFKKKLMNIYHARIEYPEPKPQI